jgi:hypothetical protein
VFSQSWNRLREETKIVLAFCSLCADHAPIQLVQSAASSHVGSLRAAIDEASTYRLATVVEKNDAGGGRIRVHPAVAGYVLRALPEEAVEHIRENLVLAYCQFLQGRHELSAGSDGLHEVADQLSNVLPMVDELHGHGYDRLAVDLVMAVEDFLNLFGLYDLRLRLAQIADQHFLMAQNHEGRSHALTILAGTLVSQGRLVEATLASSEAMAESSLTSDHSARARSMRIAGMTAYVQGLDALAQGFLRRGWGVAQSGPDVEGLVELCFLGANLALAAGDPTSVITWVRDALIGAKTMGWTRAAGYAAGLEARLALEDGDGPAAERALARGFDVAAEFTDHRLRVRLGLLASSYAARRGSFLAFRRQVTDLELLIDRLGLAREAQELRAQRRYWSASRMVRYWTLRLAGGRPVTPVRYSTARLDGV